VDKKSADYVDPPAIASHERAVTHIDWEDIATDRAGNLIIGDFGNNWKNRQDLQLYVIKEPNPFQTLKTEAIKKINLNYPDQAEHLFNATNFDAEALFVKNGK